MYKLIAEFISAVTIMSSNPATDSSNATIQYYYYSTAEEISMKQEYKVKKTKYVPIKLIIQADTVTVTQIAENQQSVKKVKDEIKYIGSGVWEYYEITDKAVFIHFKQFNKSN